MDSPDLYFSTSNQQVDAILRGTIGILETCLPDRISAYYLHGSFANNTGISTSDIDLFLVSKGSFTPEEHEKIQRIMYFSGLFSPFIVEMRALDETTLLQHGHFRIKHASHLLWGKELSQDLPEQTLDAYLDMYAHFPFIYIAPMLRNVETLTLPLSYPQASGDFFGYDQLLLPPGNEKKQNIKKMVTCVCWIASVLIAWQAGKTVAGKRESVQMYRENIHDEWTTFVEEVYELGNRQWQYLIPHQPEERRQLRDLCARTLAFENHYLHQYKEYLLAEAQKGGERKHAAMQHLRTFSA